MAGFYFAVLLCFKHLFVVAAPVYFVYLLRHYCRGGLFKGFGRLLLMGLAVVVVFVGAFWPFVCHDQLQKREENRFAESLPCSNGIEEKDDVDTRAITSRLKGDGSLIGVLST
ncbi:hypothetical protein SOVF_058530 isoform C [Spinacia oleracea]|nr:hypothetical protein SOVF_058530 isoform C [Spinacia oleracea]